MMWGKRKGRGGVVDQRDLYSLCLFFRTEGGRGWSPLLRRRPGGSLRKMEEGRGKEGNEDRGLLSPFLSHLGRRQKRERGPGAELTALIPYRRCRGGKRNTSPSWGDVIGGGGGKRGCDVGKLSFPFRLSTARGRKKRESRPRRCSEEV